MNESTVEQQLAALRREIDEHNHRYYVEDQPSVPDAEYDRLFQQLLQLEQQYPQLLRSDSPSQRVGATGIGGCWGWKSKRFGGSFMHGGVLLV